MANIVRDVIGTIAAEAGGTTMAERFADMKAIASTVMNRSVATRATPHSVVSAPKQFDAFGRAYPAGTQALRSLAAKALAEVEATGPVHPGTYYATPAAINNLPDGLAPATETTAHNYYTDPQERSIRTAVGYKRPSSISLPANVPTPTARPVNINRAGAVPNFGGFAAATPPAGKQSFSSFRAARQAAPATSKAFGATGLDGLASGKGTISYDLGKRGLVPSSGIAQKVADVANRVAPGTITSIYSGQERPGQKPVGAKDRHPNGYAGDFHFFDPTGKRITDDKTMRSIAREMAAKYDANIGYSNVAGNKKTPGYYMGPGAMHIDTMPLDKYPGGPVWGATAKQWSEDLAFERMTGIGAFPPTPTSRQTALNEIANETRQTPARQAMARSMTAAGMLGLDGRVNMSPTARVESVQRGPLDRAPSNAGLTSKAAVDLGLTSRPASTAPARSRSPAPASAFGYAAPSEPTAAQSRLSTLSSNLSMGAQRQAPPSSFPSRPAAISSNINKPQMGDADQAPTDGVYGNFADPNVQDSPVRDPRDMQNVKGPQITGMKALPAALAKAVAAQQVVAPQVAPQVAMQPRVAPVAPAAPRTAQPSVSQVTPGLRPSDIYGGTVGSAQASGGNTVARDNYGITTVTNQYGVTTGMTPNGKQTAYSPGPFGKVGSFAPPDKMKAGIGALAGAALGSLAMGPIGGLIGGLVGKNVGMGLSPLGTGIMNRSLGSFPDAPSQAKGTSKAPGGGSLTTNRSERSMNSISPAASKSISKGKAGLY